MSLLSRDQRRQIFDLLRQLKVLDTLTGRTLLLADLPPALVDTIARSEAKRLDLTHILDACAGWPAADTPHPLEVLLDNATDLAAESAVAAQFQELRIILAASVAATASGVDLAAQVVDLTTALREREAEIAALRAQLTAPQVAGEVLLPGGRRVPIYLLVAHYDRLLHFVRNVASGSTALQPMGERHGKYENLRFFARRVQRAAAALLTEMGEEPTLPPVP